MALLLLPGVLLELLDVGGVCESVDGKVNRESAQPKTEAREEVSEHEPGRKDWVLAPSLTLRPGVSVELRHGLKNDERKRKRGIIAPSAHGRTRNPIEEGAVWIRPNLQSIGA